MFVHFATRGAFLRFRLLVLVAAIGLAAMPGAAVRAQSPPTATPSAFEPPPDKQYDWIQLTSDEWLKGELKGLYAFSLEFDSDKLELQVLDWEDVKSIRTAHAQAVRYTAFSSPMPSFRLSLFR